MCVGTYPVVVCVYARMCCAQLVKLHHELRWLSNGFDKHLFLPIYELVFVYSAVGIASNR